MKFVCDSCHAQYLISDEKVGPNGVIVRCKKCQNKIVVKRAAPPPTEGEATVVMQTPAMDDGDTANNAVPPAPAIDDELGRAFESVLTKQDGEPTNSGTEIGAPGPDGLGFGLSAAPSAPPPADDPDSDRESTRVVNLTGIASLIKAEAQQEAAAAAAASMPPAAVEEKKEVKKNGTNGTNGAAAAATSPGADWFVAINDSQVGPLSLDGVRERWDKGELSADSLCWKPGMSDWKPLSSVSELAEKLAPRPAAEPEKPAGAVATGVQAPAPTPLPPQQDEPGEPEWKPSAASALESLVKDELDALDKPAPKPVVEEKAPVESKPRGLIDDLPDMKESEPLAAAPAEPARRAPAPDLEESAPVQPRKASRPPARVQADEDEAPAPRPVPHKSNTGLYIIGGAVVLLALAIVGVGVVVLTRPPAVDPAAVVAKAKAEAEAEARAKLEAEAKLKAETEAKVKAELEAKMKAEAEAKAKAEADAKAAETKVADAKPADSKGPPAIARAEPKQPSEPKPDRPEPKRPLVAQADRPAKSPSSAQVKMEDDPPEPATPPVQKLPTSKAKVDDDFDAIFGPGGGSAEPASKPEKKPKKEVFVPPAPGSGAGGGGAAKAMLEQSDVMEVVVANKGAIKACTDDAKAKDPSTSGTIVMIWSIRPDGSTTNIKSETPEFQKTQLSACLAAAIKKFKFPAYSGSQMAPIKFPFKF